MKRPVSRWSGRRANSVLRDAAFLRTWLHLAADPPDRSFIRGAVRRNDRGKWSLSAVSGIHRRKVPSSFIHRFRDERTI
jgi:hypothetical protein